MMPFLGCENDTILTLMFVPIQAFVGIRQPIVELEGYIINLLYGTDADGQLDLLVLEDQRRDLDGLPDPFCDHLNVMKCRAW